MSEKNVRIELNIGSDDSLLSLLLYEGILRVMRGSPVEYSPGVIILKDSEAFKKAFKTLKDDLGGERAWEDLIENLNSLSTDINSWPSIARYLIRIGVDCNAFLKKYMDLCILRSKGKSDKCKGAEAKIKYYCGLTKAKTDNKLLVPLGLILKLVCEAFLNSKTPLITGDIKLKPILEGDKLYIDYDNRDDPISFGLLKTDRYEGLNLWEMGRIDRQTTLYVSWKAFTLFLLGIAGSYIKGGYGNEHLMLFYKPEYLASWMAGHHGDIDPSEVRHLTLSKNTGARAISTIYEYTDTPEILSLGLLLSPALRRMLSDEEELALLSFNIVILKYERMYKRYVGWSVDIVKEDPLEKLFSLTTKSMGEKEAIKQAVVDSVSCSGSPLLEAIGRWMKLSNPDANNALNALIQLYRFYMTGSPEFFYDYTRSIYEAMEKCESSDNKRCKWRLVQYSKLFKCLGWSGTGGCPESLRLCKQEKRT
ncbi:MAG: hypothetical protein GSR79_08765 [Desulfurococcales archaeon]|nr:hypothetical protein [Desulfurococcales archaeon]